MVNRFTSNKKPPRER